MKQTFNNTLTGLTLGALIIGALATVDLIQFGHKPVPRPIPISNLQPAYLPDDQYEKVILWLEQGRDGVLVLNWEKHVEVRPGTNFATTAPITSRGMQAVTVSKD